MLKARLGTGGSVNKIPLFKTNFRGIFAPRPYRQNSACGIPRVFLWSSKPARNRSISLSGLKQPRGVRVGSFYTTELIQFGHCKARYTFQGTCSREAPCHAHHCVGALVLKHSLLSATEDVNMCISKASQQECGRARALHGNSRWAMHSRVNSARPRPPRAAQPVRPYRSLPS